MSTIYRDREFRYSRDRSPSQDDDRYKKTTVRRYKVAGAGSSNGSHVVERYDDDEDDRRSKYSHAHSHYSRAPHEHVEVERRKETTTYMPERPRSAFDPPTTEHIRERDVYYRNGDRVEVEEDIKIKSPRGWDRPLRPWDEEVHVEKRTEKRMEKYEPDTEVVVEKKVIEIDRDEPKSPRDKELRVERRIVEETDVHDYDVERYRKEVEYYSAPDPPPAPLIIRARAPEQKIIVQEAPPPAPIVLPRQEPSYIVLREQQQQQVARREPRYEDDYYAREEAYALGRERERRYQEERRRDEEQHYDEDYYVKRTIIHRDRSSSSDNRKRHLAEGGLAGAGLAALMASRQGKDGRGHEHRGQKVLAGAALGALGTEVVRRARSAYEERYAEDDRHGYDDDRYRHRSKSRSRIATGLAIVSVVLNILVEFA